jgi:hypothetical protein
MMLVYRENNIFEVIPTAILLLQHLPCMTSGSYFMFFFFVTTAFYVREKFLRNLLATNSTALNNIVHDKLFLTNSHPIKVINKRNSITKILTKLAVTRSPLIPIDNI